MTLIPHLAELHMTMPDGDTILYKMFHLPFLAKKKQIMEITFPPGDHFESFWANVFHTHFVLENGVSVMWLRPEDGDSQEGWEADYIQDLLSVGWSLKSPV